MEQIRELDMEELQIEEVDEDDSSDDDDGLIRNDGGAGAHGGFTFDTCLASLHTYLGEIDETHGRFAFLDGGAILNLPMFYLQGVVLFPEATLPLRVIQPRFKAAVERALRQVDAPLTIGVVRVYQDPDDIIRIRFATIGTTAEIRQYRQLDDGSLNVVARGQQRFRLRRRWLDSEGAPCAEVQIIEEDIPLRTPKAAFGQLASVPNSGKSSSLHPVSLCLSRNKQFGDEDDENNSECASVASTGNDHLDIWMSACPSRSDSPSLRERIDGSCSSDEEVVQGQRRRLQRSPSSRSGGSNKYCSPKVSQSHVLGLDSLESSPEKRSSSVVNHAKCIYAAPMSFWPRWVYQMYDSYALARVVADTWAQIIRSPRLDAYMQKPDLLSFYVASKLPVSESRRQELLEIDGISYRLQREIQLLRSFNLIHCKNCASLIAKRSDMVVMSTDGPLNAYVNPHGYVHEVITVYNASGLALLGSPVKEHSWFPGYAWTIANCATCNSNMGWLFTATEKKLRPKFFWGIRSSQVADDT